MDKQQQLAVFEKASGYSFTDTQLFHRAMTHTSQTGLDGKDNERLEFLGDRVLGLVVADEIFTRYPGLAEGKMALRLNRLVRRESCALVARNLAIDKIIRANSGKNNAVADSDNVLGDACEAIIAAIYLDGGLDAVRSFVIRHWKELFDEAVISRRDAKTSLQEWALGRKLAMPVYQMLERTGPDHEPHFEMQVIIEGFAPEKGVGNSKRIGEQQAATNFMTKHKIDRL